MKNALTRIAPVLAIWAFVLASQAVAGVKYCYPVTYDGDRDGYANLGGLASDDARFRWLLDSMNCPSGYVDRVGDCNDANATVHPRRAEIGLNYVDDNCNGSIDEPSVYYSAAGVMNTTTSFRMLVYLNHPDVRASAIAGNLRADITHVRLSNAGNPSTIAKRVVDSFGDAFAYARIDLANLSLGTVYRARVQFYRANANGSFTAIGPVSGWYYTMTDSLTAKVHTRFQMVLKGLKEVGDSDAGLVGYRGSLQADGTRYGASLNEAWCSEYYVWVTQNWLEGIAGLSNTSGLRDYFEDYDSFYAASEIPTRAAPGDYLYLDTNEDGSVNHSAMFLAYDASVVPARVWSLEGNSGNEVKVRTRNADWNTVTPVFLNLGYITNSMLP